MASNISVFDLDNYPSNPKTVSVDITEVVPYGNNGEDTWVFSATTTATASGGAAIQRIYIRNAKWGWAKSSGLKQGPYDVTNAQRHLKVSIDESIGSGVEVALTANALPLSGSAVASDLQNKINATARTGGSKAGNLSYLNATVRYNSGFFEIISGTASDEYTGANRSSVSVADGTTTTGLAAELGFDISFGSETFASTQIKHTSLASPYTAPSTTLSIVDSGRLSSGDCIAIMDGTNTEYRGVTTAAGTVITLSSGFSNSYVAGSLIQVLALQDPSGKPPAAYDTVDDLVKFAISSIANQIDFSR